MTLFKKTSLVLLLLSSFIGLSVQGQESSEANSDFPFGRNTGEVHGIDYDNKTIIINDFTYHMPINFSVADTYGKQANRYAIKVGSKVEYFAEQSKNRRVFYIQWLKIKKNR